MQILKLCLIRKIINMYSNALYSSHDTKSIAIINLHLGCFIIENKIKNSGRIIMKRTVYAYIARSLQLVYIVIITPQYMRFLSLIFFSAGTYILFLLTTAASIARSSQ
jgi:hypothetical protein